MIAELPSWGARAFAVGGPGGCVLVDSGMSPNAAGIARGLAELGIALRDLRAIVLTHAHADHCGGLAWLRRMSGAPVVAHRAEAPCVERGQPARPVARNALGRLMNAVLPPVRMPPCPVDLVAEGELDLGEFGLAGRLLATPGHSAGSLSLVLEEGSAIVGDLLRGRPGRLSLGMFYEDRDACVESLRLLASLGLSRFVFSHGGETDAGGLGLFLASLEAGEA